MNTRQIIRAVIAFMFMLLIGILSLLSSIYPVYLSCLQNLTLPFAALITGYYGVEVVKNINKKSE